jgi:hypothetical protein
MNARLECGADRCERAEHAPAESQAILNNVNKMLLVPTCSD